LARNFEFGGVERVVELRAGTIASNTTPTSRKPAFAWRVSFESGDPSPSRFPGL
jgi:hypothetical protein